MICLRFDLDYVPWDTARAEQYGHGEPAMVLKLLALARKTGIKFHFFISNRSLRTFSTTADAILGEGHDMDWLTHFPDDPELFQEARQLFSLAGHKIKGLALSSPWPDELHPDWLEQIEFATGPFGNPPPIPQYFPEYLREEDEVLPMDLGVRHEINFDELRDKESSSDVKVIVARPQVLAKRDPQLIRLTMLLSAGLTFRTLRDGS